MTTQDDGTLIRGGRAEPLIEPYLVLFTTPRTWDEILTMTPEHSATWWRRAVLESDEYGRGLLRWLKSNAPPSRKRGGSGSWVLTDKGRAIVARASRRSRDAEHDPTRRQRA